MLMVRAPLVKHNLSINSIFHSNPPKLPGDTPRLREASPVNRDYNMSNAFPYLKEQLLKALHEKLPHEHDPIWEDKAKLEALVTVTIIDEFSRLQKPYACRVYANMDTGDITVDIFKQCDVIRLTVTLPE